MAGRGGVGDWLGSEEMTVPRSASELYGSGGDSSSDFLSLSRGFYLSFTVH